jgi:hypothetical protein
VKSRKSNKASRNRREDNHNRSRRRSNGVQKSLLPSTGYTKKIDSVRYDNKEKDAFLVTRKDGSVIEFTPSVDGLHHCNFSKSIEWEKNMKKEMEKMMMIEMVENIKRNFMKRELETADQARRLYMILG